MKSPSTLLQEIEIYIIQPLSLEKEKIYQDLIDTEKLRSQLVKELMIAKHEFVSAQAKYRRPSEKGLTDFDRRILTNELTNDNQVYYETLDHYFLLLSDRRESLLALSSS